MHMDHGRFTLRLLVVRNSIMWRLGFALELISSVVTLISHFVFLVIIPFRFHY